MFPICMRKLDNISVRQMYRWKARFVCFWRYIQFQDQSWGLWEISKKVTIVLRKLTLQHFQRRLFLELHCAGLAHSAGRSWCGVINSPATTFAVVETALSETFAATRPSSQIALGRLVFYYYKLKLIKIKSNHIYWYMAVLRLDYTITQSRRTQSHKVGYCHWKLLTQKQIKGFLNLLVLAYMCGSLSADRSRWITDWSLSAGKR